MQALAHVLGRVCKSSCEHDGQADKTQESFGEFIIASGDSPVALDSLEEVFYSMTTPVELYGEWDSCRAVSARPGMQVLTPLAPAVCLRVELS